MAARISSNRTVNTDSMEEQRDRQRLRLTAVLVVVVVAITATHRAAYSKWTR